MGPVETKDTNPKDAIGVRKLPIGLVPSTGINLASLAFLEGAMKYGRYNWRVAGVKTSIYYDAAMRHMEKYWNGEECDWETGVPHLASAIACLMIIADAKACGKLSDDRPPFADVGLQIHDLEAVANQVRNRFADRTPHQWTIEDNRGVHPTLPPPPAAETTMPWPMTTGCGVGVGKGDPAIRISSADPLGWIRQDDLERKETK